MNHHVREGFQRTFLNDVYHVEEQLQQYDEHLYLMWNPRTNEHLVMDGLVNMAVMRIPQVGFPFLSSQVVERMKKIHTMNGFSASAALDKQEQERHEQFERKSEELADNFARDTLKAAKKIAYYQ